ncbi:3-deoxy-manno-octulosonate cytidylyltransferase [Moorella thermoacetica]|uniref:3-deoxy-manno-octulosonate cytidylyltransferase n=1 Tax=Neomoorella thermoacetica TaxID=1525 RepID=A0AAC9HGA7_NEOTH|nr:glycosyltransferase family protein [Moorella thermoacetica]AOQ23412.1 3-deoxy-manno-octulosonate cytidylyltransferase [Moorella thermoacetica]TYL13597.1 3-deoxy-manno-octulosonate cytidylyltransferase [Moorella thermoacetica]
MAKVIAIIQARMGSERLPGKVLRDLVGKPMLAHMLERVKFARTINAIIVATSRLEQDDAVADLAQNCGVMVYRGDEEDVLSRYVEAATQVKAEVVVRLTGDCPLIDPGTIDKVVLEFLKGGCDYVATHIEGSYPRGLDVEVFSYRTLLQVNELAPAGKNPAREHVTWLIGRRPDLFRRRLVEAEAGLNRPHYRLCVDTIDDFRLIEKIYKEFYRPGEIVNIEAVLRFLDEHPEIARLNAHVKQKVC